jgi:hypothetical protein
MDIGQQQADAKQTTSLIGQTFYKTFPGDGTAYRTIRVARNLLLEIFRLMFLILVGVTQRVLV